jgi:hypothetical protein
VLQADDPASGAERGDRDVGAGSFLVFGSLLARSLMEQQPKSGTVQDQFPVIRIKDEYYTMSLRMMKAVW